MTTLKDRLREVTDGAGKERFVFVSGGFAEALPDKVTILAESAERRSDIDLERAKAAMQRAQERIDKAAKDEAIDFIRAKAALTRAISRLNIAQGN
jgi:F-type H+-transporting ATPase subunit epsilon